MVIAESLGSAHLPTQGAQEGYHRTGAQNRGDPASHVDRRHGIRLGREAGSGGPTRLRFDRMKIRPMHLPARGRGLTSSQIRLDRRGSAKAKSQNRLFRRFL